MAGGDGIEKVDGCVLHSMVAVDAEKLAARQWKGDSSASMMEPQEHSKGPGAQTLGDAGGVKGAYGGTWCIRGGAEGVPAPPGPPIQRPEPSNMEFSAQMARD